MNSPAQRRFALVLAILSACVASPPPQGATEAGTGSTQSTSDEVDTSSTTTGETVSGGASPIVELRIGDREGPEDDLVPVGGDPLVRATLTLTGPDVDVTLVGEGPAALSFEPAMLALSEGTPAEIRIHADSPSAAEGDTLVRVQSGTDVLAEAPVTAITGIKIAFAGTFGFVIDNNNNWRTSTVGPAMACGGEADPEIWRATPLPCEGIDPAGTLVFTEDAAPSRFTAASGLRPPVEVEVTAVKTFGPAIDLAGRDPALDVGTQLLSPAAGRLVTDDCDDDPGTGQPGGGDQGVEPILDLALAVGDALSVAYADGASPGRTWTSLPPPETPAETRGDLGEVARLLLPAGATGCSSPSMTYFDSDGAFQCEAAQSLRELLLRNAGFRSTLRHAWANWVSRDLVVDAAPESFVAGLLAATGGGRVEGFLQLGNYDWYTLVGRVQLGVLATPGGIDAQFVAWTVADGCPIPEEPDVPMEADPYALDPS